MSVGRDQWGYCVNSPKIYTSLPQAHYKTPLLSRTPMEPSICPSNNPKRRHSVSIRQALTKQRRCTSKLEPQVEDGLVMAQLGKGYISSYMLTVRWWSDWIIEGCAENGLSRSWIRTDGGRRSEGPFSVVREIPCKERAEERTGELACFALNGFVETMSEQFHSRGLKVLCTFISSQ